MSPEPPDRLQELFTRAQGLAPEARAAFLATLPPATRAELESLLSAADGLDATFLESLRLDDGGRVPGVREIVRRLVDGRRDADPPPPPPR